MTAADAQAGAVQPVAAGSGKKLRPAPRRAKYDKGRMFKDRCIVHGRDRKVRTCVYGERKSGIRVVLIGDSHALEYAPPMIELAKERDWRLTALARAGCTMAQVHFRKSCDNWRRRALKRVRKSRPDMVVVTNSTGSRFKVRRHGKRLSRDASESVLRKGMAKTLRRIRRFKSRRGKRAKVVLIRDQALAPFRPPDCLKKKRNRRRPSRCGFRAKRRGDRAFDFRGARRVKAVQIIDPMKMLCPKHWCRAVEDGMLVYRDRYHFTATWAKTITPWLGKRLGGLR